MEEEQPELTSTSASGGQPLAMKTDDSSRVGSGRFPRTLVSLARTNDELQELLSIKDEELLSKDREIAELRVRLARYEGVEGSGSSESPVSLAQKMQERRASRSIDFGSVGSSTLPLFNAAMDSTSSRAAAQQQHPQQPKIQQQTEKATRRDVEPVHTTDTDSIRRRYTSLEKGPKSIPEGMYNDYKSLFKPNLIIEFAEDSPRFVRSFARSIHHHHPKYVLNGPPPPLAFAARWMP
jgi:hypothetical protein